jgi:hypothetical protein
MIKGRYSPESFSPLHVLISPFTHGDRSFFHKRAMMFTNTSPFLAGFREFNGE